MSSAALPQTNGETQQGAAVFRPLERGGVKRIANLDLLLYTPTCEQAVSLNEELASVSVPPPGMCTALRVCIFAQSSLLLAMAVAYEAWRMTRYWAV